MTVRELITRFGFDVEDEKLKSMEDKIVSMRGQFLKLGAVATAALGAVIVPAAALDRALRQTLTLVDVTGEAFTEMSESMTRDAQNLAEELGFTGTEVARSFYDVLSTGAQAGTKEFDELARTALKMGKTVELLPTEAVKILAKTVDAFAKSQLKASEAADIFFVASKLATTTVPELSLAMLEAGGVSKTMSARM